MNVIPLFHNSAVVQVGEVQVQHHTYVLML